MRVPLAITCMSGPRDGERLALEPTGEPPEVVLGRSPECGLSFPDDPELSRRHARLRWDAANGGWVLEDLQSSNGVFLGEFAAERRSTRPEALGWGTIFRIGQTRLRLDAPALEDRAGREPPSAPARDRVVERREA